MPSCIQVFISICEVLGAAPPFATGIIIRSANTRQIAAKAQEKRTRYHLAGGDGPHMEIAVET
jgi:hypothetical protein